MSEGPAELEELMWKANRDGDAAFYEDRLRDDALVVSKYGVMDKATVVPGIEANKNPYLETDRSAERAITIDDDTVVVSYRVDVVAVVQGNKLQLPSYASTVWNRDQAGRWWAVFHQQTAL